MWKISMRVVIVLHVVKYVVEFLSWMWGLAFAFVRSTQREGTTHLARYHVTS